MKIIQSIISEYNGLSFVATINFIRVVQYYCIDGAVYSIELESKFNSPPTVIYHIPTLIVLRFILSLIHVNLNK